MVIKKVGSLIVISLIGLLLVGCMQSPTKSNSPPVITGLKAEPTSITIGETSVISGTAYDPEGNALTFDWSSTLGYFIGSGSQVQYAVPVSCCGGIDEITVTVKDSKGQEARKTIKILISA